MTAAMIALLILAILTFAAATWWEMRRKLDADETWAAYPEPLFESVVAELGYRPGGVES